MTAARHLGHSIPIPVDRLDDVVELRAITHRWIEALRATIADLFPFDDYSGPATVSLALDEGSPVPEGARTFLDEFGGSVLRNQFPPYGPPGQIAYLIIIVHPV